MKVLFQLLKGMSVIMTSFALTACFSPEEPNSEQNLNSAETHSVKKTNKTHSREISYELDGVKLTGYFAYPEAAEKTPGILVVHEWWGHTEYARSRADMLAKMGYSALALDMYGDGKVAKHPKEAMGFMNEVVNTAGLARERFAVGMELLLDQASVDPDRLGAIGYCFGGSVVLSMARAAFPELDAVVSFHGGLQGLAPIADQGLHTKILVLNGAADPMVKEEHKQQFKQEMDAVSADYRFVEYPNALHAFTNPAATAKGEEFALPLKYDPEADRASWQEMLNFFGFIFQG